MTSRRLLLFILLGLAAWVAYMVAQPAVEALLRVTTPERWDDHTPLRSGAPDPRDWETLLDLRGPWAFRIGDDPSWSQETTDAADWDSVFVPAAWENEGFFGYDGFAWYHTTFQLDATAAERVQTTSPFLLLGRIDDADEVWLNGVYLERGGRMPPLYATASFSFRTYRLPPNLLRADGENVLAIRVYDAELAGGILEGPVAVAVPTDRNPESVPFVEDLAGPWHFRPGDDLAWAAPDMDATDWLTLHVPSIWETQGYPDLNGFGWYRKTVSLTDAQLENNLMLVLGAVDDIDQAFVNGVQVGSTGDFETLLINDSDWRKERSYRVPRQALTAGENVIAIRVYDGTFDGGIYHGPVALMTVEAYEERESLRL
ncbi:MAG: hypothetical protein Rubg2KO_39710 [Rubricoccaceae bacterium]